MHLFVAAVLIAIVQQCDSHGHHHRWLIRRLILRRPQPPMARAMHHHPPHPHLPWRVFRRPMRLFHPPIHVHRAWYPVRRHYLRTPSLHTSTSTSTSAPTEASSSTVQQTLSTSSPVVSARIQRSLDTGSSPVTLEQQTATSPSPYWRSSSEGSTRLAGVSTQAPVVSSESWWPAVSRWVLFSTSLQTGVTMSRRCWPRCVCRGGRGPIP